MARSTDRKPPWGALCPGTVRAECKDWGSRDGIRAAARFPQSCIPGAREWGGGPGWATPQDAHVRESP